jgi:hypothetical protein
MSNLTNILAFLTLGGFLVGLIKNAMAKIVLGILLAIIVLFVTIRKNGQDSEAMYTANKKFEHSDSIIATISVKLDTANSYIRKVDSLGVIRDLVRNQPSLSPKIVNYIKYVKELNQH